ncbi:Collagen type IV alpha-3-binding protein-like [Oopsacas minuta]|uniref:Collagen type IV alpha-3-binding protein-like n=1 Tax=Oopsacas minuta TaxID=111878 RepID=A0AAV7K9D1_9METZ|nr:Collagen type IV alpha-3-binding protein-like [Oopsacas minuta]
MDEKFFDANESEKALDSKETILKGDIRGIPFDTHYIGQHYLHSRVKEKVAQYATYAYENVTDQDNWSVVHEDGEMKVYRREIEDGEGIVLDPLKATHTVRGITAREMANIFFYPDTRMEWEGTLEAVEQIETLDDVTCVYRHLHKRIWPSQQRETIFCSNMCVLTDVPQTENSIGGTYFVMNFSVEHPKARIEPKLVRVKINISLACQTFTDFPVNNLDDLKRTDINCRLTYTAEVHPGGWAPAKVIRNIGKREITKFLKKISTFSIDHVSSKPIDL